MRLLLLPLLLTGALPSRPARAEAPPSAVDRLALDVGPLLTGYTSSGGSVDGLFLATTTRARAHLGRLALDGELLSLAPLAAAGASHSTHLALRLGYQGDGWRVLAGPALNVGWTAAPRLQLLPSLAAAWAPGRLGLEASVLDQAGQVPATLALTWDDAFSLGYVLPLGVSARARLPLHERWAFDARAFAFRLGNAHAVLLAVGVSARP